MAGIRAAFKVFFLNFVLQRLTETCVLFPATAYALHVGSNWAGSWTVMCKLTGFG